VATPDPTSVLDLYRFVKLAAIRRVLSHFLSRDPMNAALAERDFSSIEEILTVSGNTDEAGQEIARQALAAFHPLLLLNRTSSRSKVNTLQLQKLLRQYVGGELTLLGEIPEDPAVERSVRTYLPVVEAAPNSPAAHAFSHVGEILLQHITTEKTPRSRLRPAV
jgi:flagellar biosynthesis protein FlhG